MTKQDYTKARTTLVEHIESTRLYITRIIENQVEREYSTLNSYHDEVYCSEQALKWLDFGWESRNWTAQEWSSYDLATSNID